MNLHSKQRATSLIHNERDVKVETEKIACQANVLREPNISMVLITYKETFHFGTW